MKRVGCEGAAWGMRSRVIERLSVSCGVLIVAAVGLGAFWHQWPHVRSTEPQGASDTAVSVPPYPDGAADSVGSVEETNCFISRDELKAWRSARDFLAVDLRPRPEFERVYIPGAVNIPLRELRTKPYLKARRLLLVDRGYHGRQLAADCRTLRDEGFNQVRVLAGGLEAWRRKVGPLAGDGLAEAALDRVSAAVFDTGLQHGDWVVVDVSDAPRRSDAELIQAAAHVPYGNGGARFASRLRNVVDVSGAGPRRPVLLVDADGRRYAAITHAMGVDWPEFVYVLDGGLEAYRAERANHEAMLAAAVQPACRECAR